MDAEMEFEAFSNMTDIQNFFYGQSVFLTGVTGLVGKVVLEKLLRCCPGIGIIYLHMRPKKGLTSQQRLDKLFKLELFSKVKEVFPAFQKRVRVVEGDITEIKLGLSVEDYETICNNVSIVIHCAASVNFYDPLKVAVEHNIIPAKRVMELCHQISHLKSVVHVSTAYVKREDDGTVLEEVPKCKVEPRKIIEALEWMDEKGQKAVENFLLETSGGMKLSTYFISKALAEALIQEDMGDLPVGIVRPCYIGPTWKDPFPGWIDTLQGISGLLLAGAKGVLRTLLSVRGLKINVMPVDIVATTIITSAWHVGTAKTMLMKPFIVNCAMDFQTLPDANTSILNFVMEKREEYPLVQIFRYPDFTLYFNSIAYKVHALFDQWIPALFADFFLFIFTGKTILIKVYYKIHVLYDLFYRFAKVPWIIQIDNYLALQNKLSEGDEKLFSMNLEKFDWYDYMDNCLKGGRKFIAREDPSNIPYAKKKAKIWWSVTTILKWLLFLYFIYYMFNQSVFAPLCSIFNK